MGQAAKTARRGWPAVGLLACVLAAMVFGTGFSASRYALGDGGAWLPTSSDGSLVHVNGASGDVDWRIVQIADEDDELEVVQGPEGVYLINRTTGEITPIDPTTLAAGDAVRAGSGVTLLLGGGDTYELDGDKVRYTDPSTLATIGEPLTYPAPITGVIDRDAMLFLATADGDLVRVFEGEEQSSHPAVEPRHDLRLTLAGGRPGLVDATDATVVPVDQSSGRPGRAIELGVDGRLRVQGPSEDGERLWVTAVRDRRLIGTDLGARSTIESPIPDTERPGAPQITGDRVFVPAFDRGSLLRFDAADGRFLDEVDVGIEPGRAFDAMVKDGFVFVNDPGSDAAAVVDGSGRVRAVDKGAPAPGDDGQGFDVLSDRPPPIAGVTAPIVQPGAAPAAGGGEPGPPIAAPTIPTGTDDGLLCPPGPPRDVRAVAGPEGSGSATVSWARPADNCPTMAPFTYRVTAAPSGVTAETAATSVTLSGLPFAQAQTFSVVAVNELSAGPPTSSGAVTVLAANGTVGVDASSPGPDLLVVTLTVTPPAGESAGGCTVDAGTGPQAVDCGAGLSAPSGPGTVNGEGCATFAPSGRAACAPFSVTVFTTGTVSSSTQSAIHAAPNGAVTGTMTAGASYTVDAICDAGGAWLRLADGSGWLGEYDGGPPANLRPSCS